MSSNNIAIKVENISKCYRIGVKENMYDSIGGAIFDFIKSPLKNYRKYSSLYKFDDVDSNPDSETITNSTDVIWALRNISFEVKQGEAVGIIGKNGAGKSTILKILSRITPPTSGYAEIQRRVTSLLEIGTGFHPELTGRENVYLNGTILGMTKKEIDRKFDEIVDFSGVERFIDTPIKRYSSGMKVRLAFAVAAYLEPEIMIVDEVLAVGDAAFQKKCLGKMGDVAKEGRTVVFVSHQMGAVAQLCKRVFLLEDGQLKLTGSPSDVISTYLSSETAGLSTWIQSPTCSNDVEVQMKSVRVLSEDNQPIAVLDFDKQFKVEISYEVINPIRMLSILYRLADSQGNIIWTSWDTDNNYDLRGRTRESGLYLSICKVPGRLLRPGPYHLSVGSLTLKTTICYHENVLSFDVSQVGYNFLAKRIGIITPLFEWNVNQIDGTNRVQEIK